MKQLQLLLATFALLNFSQAFAGDESGAFSGPYVSIGAGSQYNNIVNSNVKATTGFPSFDQPSASNHGFLGQVSVGYGFNIGQKFNLSTNLFYNFGDNSVGDIKATFYQDNVKQELKNSAGISLSPGYYLNDNTLVFFKVGYARADKQYARETQSINLNNPVNGYLWGIGIKHLITNNIFVGADLTKYNYGDGSQATNLRGLDVVVSSKAEQTNALISIGYKF